MGVGVAKDVVVQQALMGLELALGVEAPARVIEVDLACLVEAAVLFLPQFSHRSMVISGTSRLEFLFGRGKVRGKRGGEGHGKLLFK